MWPEWIMLRYFFSYVCLYNYTHTHAGTSVCVRTCVYAFVGFSEYYNELIPGFLLYLQVGLPLLRNIQQPNHK